MSEIQIFNNPQFGEIRTAGTADEPLFCLADVCKAVGIANARNVKSRLDEDDARIRGGEDTRREQMDRHQDGRAARRGEKGKREVVFPRQHAGGLLQELKHTGA